MAMELFKIFYFEQKARYVYVCSSVRVFAACPSPAAPALRFTFLLSQSVTVKSRAVDSQLVAHLKIFRLFMKGKFNAYAL